MTVLAATRAGGTSNQDRYVIGQNFAAVLDGATSFAEDRSHDPGWYAEQLGRELARIMLDGDPLPAAVAAAIRAVRDAHDLDAATTPTSTIALARWSPETVETYVLGDSLAIILHPDGTETVSQDERLATVATTQRNAYRTHLAQGHGYDDQHCQTLQALQAEQARHRNRPGGYWIAGADPEAGSHGLMTSHPAASLAALLLASDGVALDRHPTASTWRDVYTEARHDGPARVLQRIHDAEEADPDGQRWPRAKRHDDKTLVAVLRTGLV